MDSKELRTLDFVDKVILNKIQVSFPLAIRPYRLIAAEAGVTENEAWQRIQSLREKNIIRRIGGIFNSRRLGYVSTLCAARVPEAKIAVLSDLMEGITEITHNYLRDHPRYNMWFTIIASSQERLEKVIAEIRAVLGSDEVYSLPATKVFKIGVLFHLKNEGMRSRASELTEISQENYHNKIRKMASRIDRQKSALVPTEEDKRLIRLLQGDLPSSFIPFTDLAQELNKDVNDLLADVQRLLDKGMMRRLGAILVHRKTGFTSNAMGVWIVPEEKVSETGFKMAEFPEVSHCYERRTLEDWPYNIFTMIHGNSDEECKQIMSKISEATGIKDYDMLFSYKELKKSSMRYFI